MFSVHAAASIFYYLNMKEGQDAEKTLLADTARPDGRPNYYDPLAADDALASQAVWAGGLAAQLGYAHGSAVTKQALAAAWFAVDPADGKTSLLKNGPTISDQLKAQQVVAAAETNLFNTTENLKKLRSRLYNEGSTWREIDDNARVTKLTAAVALHKEALKKAKAPGGDYRADAHDCTFSAPKGVSVYWARLKTEGQAGDAAAADMAGAIERAMVESVSKVVEKYIEKQLLFTRNRQGGNKEVDYQNVKGIASALFLHFDARPTAEEIVDPSAPNGRRIVERLPDPQMHVHALLMNMGLRHDDEIQALWTTFLSSHAKAIGAAFRGELAHKLREMGLDLKVDEQKKILGFDISGVTDEVAGKFSARRAQVAANMAEGMDSETAVLSGRETKAAYTGAELLTSWGERLDALGLSSQRIAQTTNAKLAAAQADDELERALAAGALAFERDTPQWEKALAGKYNAALARLEGDIPTVEAAVEKLLSMETAFTMTDIHRVSFEASQFCDSLLKAGQGPMEWAEEFRASILRAPELKQVHGYDNYGRPTFTSHGLVRREKELYYQSIPKMLLARPDAIPPEAVEAGIAKYQASLPFALHDFQKDMIREMVLSPGSIHIALAPAGSGKTTADLGAVYAWESMGLKVHSLAPSNKAAQGLAQDLRKARSEGLSPQLWLSRIKAKTLTLTSKDVILIDEASMLDFDTAKAVVDACLAAEGGPARLVLQGDTEQLPAVGRGNFLRALAESESFQVGSAGAATITRVASEAGHWDRISRQRDDLGKQATTFFAIGQTARALDIYERMGALKLSATREEALTALAYDAYLPLAGASDDFNAVRAEREARYKAFFKQGNQAAKALVRAKPGSFDPEAFVAAFTESDQAAARQWLEDKAALEAARAGLIEKYSKTLMLASKNVDVDALNKEARSILKTIGALGGLDGSQRAEIPRGRVGAFEICEGDRLMFKAKADASVAHFETAGDSAAKTTVGTVIGMSRNTKGSLVLQMRLDGSRGGVVTVDTSIFDQFDYAFCVSTHASQGMTCDNVYKFVSDFASMQTEYVGDSRHREVLAMRAVESEYAIYKKRAGEAIVKTDAIDLSFSIIRNMCDQEQLAELDKAWSAGSASGSSAATILEASRMRAIAQGTLIEHGAATLGFKEGAAASYYAKLSVGGKTVTLWGAGIAQALASTGAKTGDHVGLEALSGSRASGETMAWRGYGAVQLQNAGLLMDEEGIKARARKVMSARSGAAKAERAALMEETDSEFLSDKEAHAIAEAVIAKASTVSARRAQERGVLDALNRRASLPADLEARIEAATEALPFAKRGAADQARHALAFGIDVMAYEQPMFNAGREWIALDSEMAYCLTEWGTVEAWSAAGLSKQALAEARGVGGSIDKLAERRLQTIELARRAALDPAAQAFGALGKKVEFSIIEHADYGLCLGVNATEPGTHKTDPELKRLFVGAADYGQDSSLKKNGIGGLRHCKKYDPRVGAWLFPLRCDALGAPTGDQPAVAELLELGERLGHSVMARSAWDIRRADAWNHVEARLAAPWGLAFARACAEMGIKVDSPNEILSRTLKNKSNDVVRWDGLAIQDLGTTQEWELASATAADGSPLMDGARRLAGVVLHADAQDVYVLRNQRVLAIGREELGLDAPADDLVGKRISILFTKGADHAIPTLESFESDRLIDKGREISARIASGERPDLARMNAGQAVAYARVGTGSSPSPYEQGHALAWAYVEAADLEAVRKARAEGMGPEAAGAEPLEAHRATAKLAAKNVRVVKMGSTGALLEIGKKRFLADKEQVRQAVPRGAVAGAVIDSLKLQRDATGRISIDAAGTLKAARAIQR
jgi:hypothetical protein